MKVNQLEGAALDWAVAKAEGFVDNLSLNTDEFLRCFGGYKPSRTWSQGGPIIQEEMIEIFRRDEEWFSYSINSKPEDFQGPTPLVAAMRCYVASRFGDEIEVPAELLQGEEA